MLEQERMFHCDMNEKYIKKNKLKKMFFLLRDYKKKDKQEIQGLKLLKKKAEIILKNVYSY